MVQQKLPLWVLLKLGLFHVGSAMIDLLVVSIWNRVMIVELGVAATPVVLVTSLHNFLTPLFVWGGYLSDERPIFGLRRLPYALGGRLVMVAPFFALPVIGWSIARGESVWWLVALVAFAIFGVGRAVSGTAYLALIHDRAPEAQRGRALGFVWLMLIVGFSTMSILYGRLLPTYDPVAYQRLFIIAPLVAVVLFVIALWGEEKPHSVREGAAADKTRVPFSAALRVVWDNRSARIFAAFLFVSSLFMFAYDQILEPFGGDVFGLPVGITTRWNAYWGVGVLVSMISLLALTGRKRRPRDTTISAVGTVGISLAFVVLTVASLAGAPAAVVPGVVLLGLSMGVFNVGGLSLMMRMSDPRLAGTFLGMWSLMQLMGRGFSGLVSASIRDTVVMVTGGDYALAYGLAFAVEAIGVAAALWLLLRLNVDEFTQTVRVRANEVFAAAAD